MYQHQCSGGVSINQIDEVDLCHIKRCASVSVVALVSMGLVPTGLPRLFMTESARTCIESLDCLKNVFIILCECLW